MARSRSRGGHQVMTPTRYRILMGSDGKVRCIFFGVSKKKCYKGTGCRIKFVSVRSVPCGVLEDNGEGSEMRKYAGR